MNPTPPHERVSAFFDEELSSSEIEDVTRLLAESESARRELSDIRQLSEDLRSLPRESASHAILSGVMNQVSCPNSHAVARSGSWNNSPWRLGTRIAMAAAIVALIAWIPFFWNRSNPVPPNSVVDSPSKTLTEIADQERTEILEPVVPDTVVVANRDSQRRRVDLGTEAEMLAQARKPRTTIESPQVAAVPANPVEKKSGAVPPQPNGQSLGTPSLAHNSLSANLADGLRKQLTADSEVWKILQHAQSEQVGERVAVVDVTNANSQAALRELQALFAKNAVPVVSASPASGFLAEYKSSGDKASEDKAEAAKDDSQFALYVEATPAQASAVLSQLRAQRPAAKLESNKTIARGEIPIIAGEERTADRAPQRLMKSIEVDAVKDPEADTAGDAKETNQDAKKPAETKPKTALQKGVFRQSKQDAEEPNRANVAASFQLLVEIPRVEAAPSPPKKRAESRPPAAELQQKRTVQGFAGATGGSPAATVKPHEEHAVVRLLFIFRQPPVK